LLLAHKKKALHFRMSDTVSLISLFISSFLAATLLPGGSEAALFAVLKTYPETLWVAPVIATVGNTLGGMATFGMGWLLPQRKGGSKAAGHPPAYSSRVQTQQLKHVDKVRPRHGGAKLRHARASARLGSADR
jgi:membrane protein YqaA with SNARE-associated domain